MSASAYPTVDGVQVFLPAPPGYVVNFENPARNGAVAAFWSFGVGNVLALVFLGQRLYTKLFLANGLQREDFLILISWIFSEITQGILIYEFAQGMEGVHGWELPIVKYKTFLLLSWIGPWAYLLCGSAAKLSLLTVYFRLSPFGWFRKLTQASFALVIVHTVVLFILMTVSCWPVQKSWDLTILATEGHCIDVVALYFATAVANILTDAILMIMPIPLMMGLNMPKVQKVGCLIVLIFASGTIVSSIVRLSYLPSLLSDADETWDISQASIWAIIEANLVIVCASITTLRRFLCHVTPGFMGHQSGGGEARNSRITAHTPLASLSRGKPMNRRSQFASRNGHEMCTVNMRTLNDVEGGQDNGEYTELGDTAADEAASHKGILQTKTVSVQWEKEISLPV